MNVEFDPELSRAIARDMERERAKERDLLASARPFRFEDLNGKPEPAHWGPVYPKTASASVEKWRAIARGRALTRIEAETYGAAVHDWIRALNAPKRAPDTLSERSNSASGQAGEFSAAKYRASIKARFAAQAATDRRQWAEGKAKGFAKGEQSLTIRQVYARAMAEKRAREAFLADCEAFARAKLPEAA